jgi:glycosyl hydrolase family 113
MPDPPVSELVSAWSERGYVAALGQASALAGKPVLFTEIGYRSQPYAAAHPGVWDTFAPPDPQAQANAYEAAYEVFSGQPWFAGMYWWNWPALLPADGQDSDYPPILKPAENVMSAWNARLRAAG